MFVLYIYMCVCEQYNPETVRRNTLKLKHSISIEKLKHLSKRNQQPWFEPHFNSFKLLNFVELNFFLVFLYCFNILI